MKKGMIVRKLRARACVPKKKAENAVSRSLVWRGAAQLEAKQLVFS